MAKKQTTKKDPNLAKLDAEKEKVKELRAKNADLTKELKAKDKASFDFEKLKAEAVKEFKDQILALKKEIAEMKSGKLPEEVIEAVKKIVRAESVQQQPEEVEAEEVEAEEVESEESLTDLLDKEEEEGVRVVNFIPQLTINDEDGLWRLVQNPAGYKAAWSEEQIETQKALFEAQKIPIAVKVLPEDNWPDPKNKKHAGQHYLLYQGTTVSVSSQKSATFNKLEE